jgi:hypothetical protein
LTQISGDGASAVTIENGSIAYVAPFQSNIHFDLLPASTQSLSSSFIHSITNPNNILIKNYFDNLPNKIFVRSFIAANLTRANQNKVKRIPIN